MPATPDHLFAVFDDLGIGVTRYEHEPLFTVEDSQAMRGEIPGAHCKNLFLKDKKGVLWLIVALEETPVDLKTLPKVIGSARLSFGKPDLLEEVLGVQPGSVTPFALINDLERRVNVVLDAAMFEHDVLNYHPLINTMTVTIARDDLLRFIDKCGHQPQTRNLSEPVAA